MVESIRILVPRKKRWARFGNVNPKKTRIYYNSGIFVVIVVVEDRGAL